MSFNVRCPRVAACCLAAVATSFATASAEPAPASGETILQRHIESERTQARRFPRTEGDQAVVDGWPLYRTPRAQGAFNAAMATLHATDGPAPKATLFKGCESLACAFAAPRIGDDGWLPQGRVWVSPDSYVLFVHSPRQPAGRAYPRRRPSAMKFFVLHEFNNSSRNTDVYDTISSHKGSVFVPLYMSREGTDAKGRHFVVIVQTAPYDVVSIHATNRSSAGPGIEVAKNTAEALDPLQGVAGILISTIVKAADPDLKVVNHRGNEGLPMLDLYERTVAGLARNMAAAPLKLPFVPAAPERITTATAPFGALILLPGQSPPLAVAERAFTPTKAAAAGKTPQAAPSASLPTTETPPAAEAFATAAAAPPLLRGPVRLATRPARLGATPQLVGPIKVITRPSVPVAGAGG